MKDLRGSASVRVAASAERCFELLCAVESYPAWYPAVVRRVDVLERDEHGHARSAQTTLHLAHGPIVRDFDLLLDVRVQPSSSVRLRRVAHGSHDGERFEVLWGVSGGASGAASSELSVELLASLAVPRLLPLGGLAESIAEGFVRAAADALESPA